MINGRVRLNPKIRQAVIGDKPAVEACHPSFEPTDQMGLVYLDGFINDGSVWVCEATSGIVGFAIISSICESTCANCIFEIFVKKTRQGGGFGSFILREIGKKCCKPAYLCTRKKNLTMQHVATKCGWRLCDPPCGYEDERCTGETDPMLWFCFQ